MSRQHLLAVASPFWFSCVLACSAEVAPEPSRELTDSGEQRPDACAVAQAVHVMGHRGSGRNAQGNPFAENTLPSLVQAARDGAEYVEIDVALSADGALVLMHDDLVDRTTDGSGCVGELTLAELRTLDAASGTAMAGTGVTVPTLQEALAAVDASINVEAKLPSKDGACVQPDLDRFADALVAAIDADRADRDIFVAAFSPSLLERMVGRGHALVLHRRNPERAAQLDLDGVNVASDEHIAESVATARGFGLDTLTVTAEPTAIRRALELGVTYILSDSPELVRAEQRAMCTR
jgi:glycerophosphoryl diester phosphodiesterase